MLKIRKEVILFSEMMEKKLRENDYKGGWKSCTADYLEARAVDEMKEVFNCKNTHNIGLIEECADVANFLMMLCDIEGKLKRTKTIKDCFG